MLEFNGKRSVGNRSQVLNICYFSRHIKLKKEKRSIEYLPTDKMWEDFTTKLRKGAKFR